MPELDEFVEALLDQLSVEVGEEEEIQGLASKIRDDEQFKASFADSGEAARPLYSEMSDRLDKFAKLRPPDGLRIKAAELDEFKQLKARKVFAAPGSQDFVDELFGEVAKRDVPGIVDMVKRNMAKYLVYSTYAIQYLAKISTTYGDYLDHTIYLNKFVLDSYPRIILYKQGPPYSGFDEVNSGYTGALKMTILEETIHACQGPLQSMNKEAAVAVNAINEELAGIILTLDDQTASSLYEYMQLQTVPDDFPVAKRANLFFMLNPDNFIVNVLGPDVMTYNRMEIDPKIASMVPQIADVYQRWLGPIQSHHAAFTAMEGMAGFIVEGVLDGDSDFGNYLGAFMGTDWSAYRVKKDIGKEFTRAIHEQHSTNAFEMIIKDPPTTKELKDSAKYLERIG